MSGYIQRHPESSLKQFLMRTVAAQSHLVASVFALVGLVILVQLSYHLRDSKHFWACLVFGLTSLMVFVASTVFHFLSDGFIISPQLNKRLEDLDHFAIYLFIAGSYTAFVVNAVQPPWNRVLLIVIWSVAFTGIFYTYFKPRLPIWAQHRFVYTGIFVLMGWALLFRIGEVFSYLNLTSLLLLFAGGLSYTFGAIIYALKRPNFIAGVFGFHELWHLMVMLGFAFHYLLILGFYYKY
jgi:hemolysin III